MAAIGEMGSMMGAMQGMEVMQMQMSLMNQQESMIENQAQHAGKMTDKLGQIGNG